jgi:mannitol-1-phosphate/altronate dehydrogenase
MSATPKTFVGFGFGAIQAGLFLYEAFRSGNFERLVVAEVAPELVAEIRRAGGRYRINIATPSGIEVQEVRGVEIFDPTVPEDARALVRALGEASEISTALPSVDFYDRGEPSVADLIAEAAQLKAADGTLPCCVVYTAENHNHAAEILQQHCPAPRRARIPHHTRIQFLNTVIGKMSGIVTDAAQIAADNLACVVDGSQRAILVEQFNRILISRIGLPEFDRGIRMFVEKSDLLPFEEAKLYGHNAIHALLGYLARRHGYRFMSETTSNPVLLALARSAFLEESGAALLARHQGLDPLFTPKGYTAYADDLLARMTNPYLRDAVERVTRDTLRKLGWDDRLIGTMRLALDAGVTPHRFALGAAAALETIGQANNRSSRREEAQIKGVPSLQVSLLTSAATVLEDTLSELWPAADQPRGRKSELIRLIKQAQMELNGKET